MRITHVRAENLRIIRELSLELRPFTVVVGPNGAGKSTILELLYLFRGIENHGHLNAGFSTWGGYGATVREQTDPPILKLGLTVGNGTTLDYDVAFGEEGGACFVRSEVLRSSDARRDGNAEGILLHRTDVQGVIDSTVGDPKGAIHFAGPPELMLRFRGGGASREFSIPHGPSTALSGVRSYLPQAEPLFRAAKRSHLWQVHKFQPSERVVRTPQPLAPADQPSVDGGDLFSVLYGLRTERRDAFDELQHGLRLAVPEFEELEFPVAGAGHVNLTWKQSNYKRPLYANQLSDGQLRILWLLAVIHSAQDDGLILLDEPELSLHPQWILLLISMLRQLSARTNVLVATQSAEFVRWLERDELLIADIDEEGTTFSWADQKVDLDKWLKDFTLSELWTMGELGGRR